MSELTAQQATKLIAGLDRTLKDVCQTCKNAPRAEGMHSINKCKSVMLLLFNHLRDHQDSRSAASLNQATFTALCNSRLLSSLTQIIQALGLTRPMQTKKADDATADTVCAMVLWWTIIWLHKEIILKPFPIEGLVTEALNIGLLQVLCVLDADKAKKPPLMTDGVRTSTVALLCTLTLVNCILPDDPHWPSLIRGLENSTYLQQVCKRIMDHLHDPDAVRLDAQRVLWMMHAMCDDHGRYLGGCSTTYLPKLMNDADTEGFLRAVMKSLLIASNPPPGPLPKESTLIVDPALSQVPMQQQWLAKHKHMALTVLETLCVYNSKWRSCAETFDECLILRRTLGLMADWPMQEKIMSWLTSLPASSQEEACLKLTDVILEQLCELPVAMQQLAHLQEGSRGGSSNSSSRSNSQANGGSSSSGSSSSSVALSPGSQLAVQQNYEMFQAQGHLTRHAKLYPWLPPGGTLTINTVQDGIGVLQRLVEDMSMAKIVLPARSQVMVKALEGLFRSVPLHGQMHGMALASSSSLIGIAISIKSLALISGPDETAVFESLSVSMRKFILHWVKALQEVRDAQKLQHMVSAFQMAVVMPCKFAGVNMVLQTRDLGQSPSSGLLLALKRLLAVMDAVAEGNWNVAPTGQLESPTAVTKLIDAVHRVLLEGATPSVGCWHPGCSNLSGDREAEMKLLKCSSCKVARYCCAECQKADWKAHKVSCQR